MDEYNIRGLPAPVVPDLWRFAEPFVLRALEHTFGELSADDIKNLCLGRDAQLWVITKGTRVVGAGTTMLMPYPQMLVCRIITLAGNEFDAWKEMAHSQIEQWAVSQGCKDVEAYVRRGFVPKLMELGYKHRYSVVHKTLKE